MSRTLPHLTLRLQQARERHAVALAAACLGASGYARAEVIAEAALSPAARAEAIRVLAGAAADLERGQRRAVRLRSLVERLERRVHLALPPAPPAEERCPECGRSTAPERRPTGAPLMIPTLDCRGCGRMVCLRCARGTPRRLRCVRCHAQEVARRRGEEAQC